MTLYFGDPKITKEVTKMKAKRDLKGLVKMLEGKRDKSRGYARNQAAAEALGELGDVRAVDPLMGALHHEDGRVRLLAVEALRTLGDARAVEPLITALQDHGFTEWESEGAGRPAIPHEVCEAAAYALGELGDARAVEPLIKVLQEDTKFPMRERVILALCKLGDVRAVGALIDFLSDVSGIRPSVEEGTVVRYRESDPQARSFETMGDYFQHDLATVSRGLLAMITQQTADIREDELKRIGDLKDSLPAYTYDPPGRKVSTSFSCLPLKQAAHQELIRRGFTM
jgi:hypothetical protein